MTGILEMFAELDGRDRYEMALARAIPPLEDLRAYWRDAKKRQRDKMKASGKRRTKDQSYYAERYKNDAEFRERRKAYWRDRDARLREARKAAA